MKKKYVLLVALCLCFFSFGQEAYYSNVDLTLTGLSLKNELATKIIGTHTNFLSYSEAYQVIKLTDKDLSNSANVVLFYNGQTAGQNSTIGGGNSTNPEIWNREHTFAQSQGTPNIGTSGPGSDVHNLRACEAGVNNTRASRKFATGTGTNGVVGANYYPGDNYKGDVARIIMYMYVRYGSQCLPTNAGVGSSASTPDDMIDLFLSWNAEDPVSDIEVQRNTVLENLQNGQGNRNPFIDNPYLATLIWGGQPAEDLWGIFTTPDMESPSVPTNLNTLNPTASSIQLNWTASTDNNGVTSYDIYQDGVNSYSATTTNFIVTGLNAETNYCFNVVALDQAGNTSMQSIQACQSTLIAGTNDTDCNAEDFENIGPDQSNYSFRTWNDSNGLTWNATDARTDQSIISKSITVRDGALTSPTINGGIGNLTVSTKRVFGGSMGTFNVLINGSNVGTVGFGNQDEIITTTLSNINIEGNIQVVLDKNGDSNRVAIDNLSWTCYTTLSNSNINVNEITIYPNPLNNDLLFINSKTNLSISIYTILGKEVFSAKSSKSKNHMNLNSLKAGIYLIKLEENNRIYTKKLIIK